MLKEERSTLCLKSSTTRARVCDTCCSTPSTIFCRADLAYLCTGCDTRIHAANKSSSRHERVWVCEACEQAPAAFICNADAASLCTTCDADIHSANPLARRHHRVPVMPLPGSFYGPQATDPRSIIGLGVESQGGFLSQQSEDTIDNEDEDEAASWLLFDAPPKNSQTQNQTGNTDGFLFNGEGGVDEYLDLVEYNSCRDTQFTSKNQCNDLQFTDDHYTTDTTNNSNILQQRCYTVPQKSYGGGDADSLVPIQGGEAKKHHQLHHQNFQHQQLQLGMEYEAGYSYPASLRDSVSMSSMDAGIVPDSTVMEASISNARTPKGTIDLFSSPPVQMPAQFNPMDREARVLRYREKKKTRKFEKTIRYASRKAYAETRPRIKGRFAKRTNVDIEVEQMYSTSLTTDGGYCIVPSF